jgi:lipoprotein-releasing system ATP-binding protein
MTTAPTADSRAAAGVRRGASVSVRGLTKVFEHSGRHIEVLRGLDFDLRPGEMASVVGASGVGKSTLLHVLGTLDTATAGTITFDGVDVTAMNAARFTALENVMMPGLIMRLPRPEASEKAATMLRRLGLGERLSHRPGELSGGEQQRVALARALLLRPRLLLADEPTGNLDAKTGREMHELFFELNRELEMTILIVTHNDELAAQTPRRLRMADGVIVEQA